MRQRGQSMTEMAIITPILLIVFLGLVDVGRYMIAHQYVIGISRDLARKGIREKVLDYYATVRADVGYTEMKGYLDEIMQPTIAHAYDLDKNIQVRISLLSYSTGPVFCDIDPCIVIGGNTLEDCFALQDLHLSDDELTTPDDLPLWLQVYGQDYSDVRPRDYNAIISRMRTETIRQACRMTQRRPDEPVVMLTDQAVIVEVIYKMDWWFVPYGDPTVYRYTQTRARQ